MMAHPIHLHGHAFQVIAIDGRPTPGAVRDTVLVTPMAVSGSLSTSTIRDDGRSTATTSTTWLPA
jgi:FtsP/CotA-like multicopper oxidase with cupredoxin domain